MSTATAAVNAASTGPRPSRTRAWPRQRDHGGHEPRRSVGEPLPSPPLCASTSFAIRASWVSAPRGGAHHDPAPGADGGADRVADPTSTGTDYR